MTLETLLESVSAVVGSGIEWIGNVATCVVGNPLLLFGTLIGFAGIGIGLFKRIFSA